MAELLTQAEQEAVRTCVAEVEAATAGEILPVVAKASSSYPRAAVFGGLCLGVSVALPAALFLSPAIGLSELWTFLGLLLPVAFIFYKAVARVDSLKRLFVPPTEMEIEVEQASRVAFLQHGVHRTRDSSGILIYVSVFEQRVRLLADDGIAAVVDEAEWRRIVDDLTAAIQDGRTAEGLCSAVRRCGDKITQHFPRRDDDRNELADLVLDDSG